MTKRALAELIGKRPETLSRSMHRPSSSPYEQPVHGEAYGACLSYRPGQRVHTIDPASVYMVNDGTVRLFVEDRSGRQITVDEVAAGGSFGFSDLSAEALTAATVSRLSSSALLELLDLQPRIACELVQQVGMRLERVELRLLRAHGRTARTRLASLLEELAAREQWVDGEALLPASWTHAALAREVGLRRETVTRALGHLAAEGRVRQQGHRLIVRRPPLRRAP